MEWWKQKYIVFKVVVKYFYLKLLQSMYLTVSHVYKNTYEIQYVLHDHIYKFRTNVKRGPSKIIQIIDHLDNDITYDIRSYLGPNEDFHGGKPLCPQEIGYERICFLFRNGDKVCFNNNEPLLLEKS